MKKIILLLAFILMSKTVKSQSHILESTIGQTVFGSGDFIGTNLGINYHIKVKKNLYLISGINMSSGTETEITQNLLDFKSPQTFRSNHALKFVLGPSLVFRPIKHHILSFDLLGMLNSSKVLYHSGFVQNPDKTAPPDFRYFILPATYEKGINFGGLGQIGYSVGIKNGFSLGLKYNILVDKSGYGERNSNFCVSKRF